MDGARTSPSTLPGPSGRGGSLPQTGEGMWHFVTSAPTFTPTEDGACIAAGPLAPSGRGSFA